MTNFDASACTRVGAAVFIPFQRVRTPQQSHLFHELWP